MKRLTRIRLVNWYHILDETLPIGGSALFMGDNGSGKSTILDAIQFVLVADLGEVKFNQAANENAARSLQGYTRWMVNAGESKESHEYGRNDCTSYVLLEFTERFDDGDSVFTIGAVVDSFRDGRDPIRLHFAMHQAGIDQIPVFREGSRIPMTASEFRKLLGPRKGFAGYREPGPFRDDLLTRLGRLSPDFTKILVKAQAFKPLGRVQQFVTDFLLDARPLETASLQANLSSYKALEQKALEAERRVEVLERVSAQAQEFARLREEIVSHRYLEIRSLAGIQEEAITARALELSTKEKEKAAAVELLSKAEARQKTCKEELGSTYRALVGHAGYVERERVRRDLVEAQARKAQAEADSKRSEAAASALHDLRERLVAAFAGEPSFVEKAHAGEFRDCAYLARRQSDELDRQLGAWKKEGEELQSKLEQLSRGVRPYKREIQGLRDLVTSRVGCDAPLLCELIEVKDERWQAAVEGYLNTKRFDVILEPEHFQEALSLYERNKREFHLEGVGLVDSEKCETSARGAKPGSLGEMVSSPNRWAKAYADFLLGDVMRCESESELRKHSRSITPSCMVYQNHAARQTPFHVFESWFIGSRGQAKQVEIHKTRIAELHGLFVKAAESLGRWKGALLLAENAESASQAASLLGEALARLAAETEHCGRLARHLESIQTDGLEQLEALEKRLRDEEAALGAETARLNGRIGGLTEGLATLQREIGNSERERDRCLGELSVEFSAPSLSARRPELEKRYEAELERKGGATKIHSVFSVQRRNRESAKSSLLESLTAIRTEYNNLFGFSAPAQGEDATPYLAELDSWKGSHLPEYRQKIEKAKDAALQQLMEDVVHKLRENLELVDQQFEQINRALRNFRFGQDQYQFVHKVKREYLAFVDLIHEAAKYEKQPLFETNWRERFRDGGALEQLFSSLVGGSSAQVEEELRGYADYREYFEYDIRVQNGGGRISYYSQVNRLSSGGETQAPYYIAVLASLYRLYRLHPDSSGKGRGTIGLVILDEAFNKMDEDRLKATLDFTRELGLQLIMATPKERAEFIIPHVETCWLVAKDPESGLAILQDFHQDLPSNPPPAAENHAYDRLSP